MGLHNKFEQGINMKLILLSITLIFNYVLGGEWLTLRGFYCIDKCKYHGDDYYAYWCHVTDDTKHFTDGKWSSWSYRDDGPQTHLKWDKCIPSEIEPDDNTKDFNDASEANSTPEWHDPNHSNIKNNNTTNYPVIKKKGATTPLYKFTKCKGPCNFRNNEATCSIDGGHPWTQTDQNGQPYYDCMTEEMPPRQQLSSNYRLWCMGSCRRESDSHYTCPTLYGKDSCSPRKGQTNKGTNCAYPCELEVPALGHDYYFCYTRRDNSTWEYCGNWDVPQEKKTALEFTHDDYVCGDYCKPDEDNYEWCYHVYWNYNSTSNEAELMKTWDYCRGHKPPGMAGWSVALIVIGVIAAIIATGFGISQCAKK